MSHRKYCKYYNLMITNMRRVLPSILLLIGYGLFAFIVCSYYLVVVISLLVVGFLLLVYWLLACWVWLVGCLLVLVVGVVVVNFIYVTSFYRLLFPQYMKKGFLILLYITSRLFLPNSCEIYLSVYLNFCTCELVGS